MQIIIFSLSLFFFSISLIEFRMNRSIFYYSMGEYFLGAFRFSTWDCYTNFLVIFNIYSLEISVLYYSFNSFSLFIHLSLICSVNVFRIICIINILILVLSDFFLSFFVQFSLFCHVFISVLHLSLSLYHYMPLFLFVCISLFICNIIINTEAFLNIHQSF